MNNFIDFLRTAPKYSLTCKEEFFHSFYVNGLSEKFHFRNFSVKFIFENLPLYHDLKNRAKTKYHRHVSLSRVRIYKKTNL